MEMAEEEVFEAEMGPEVADEVGVSGKVWELGREAEALASMLEPAELGRLSVVDGIDPVIMLDAIPDSTIDVQRGCG